MGTGIRAAVAALALALAAVPALALERTLARAPGRDGEEWTSAGTCTIRYYNNCTGWIWVWSGWADGDRLGTAFDRCCNQAVLNLTYHLTFSGIGIGYGFTGTIGVYAADSNDCPVGPALASQIWEHPLYGTGTSLAWDVAVPPRFVVQVTWGSLLGFVNTTGFASDRPAGGPTGPQACGQCYPTSRTVNSYWYGQPTTNCPGDRLNDGVCDVEWVTDVHLVCPVHVEDRSWGGIKSLYR